MADDLEKEKRKLIKWLEGVNNPSTLREVSMVMEESAVYSKSVAQKESTNDWYLEISEAEKKSIDAGLADIKAGRTIPHSEVRKLYEKYL